MKFPMMHGLPSFERAWCRQTLELRLDVISETNVVLNIKHWN